jgi:hypothetical protein
VHTDTVTLSAQRDLCMLGGGRGGCGSIAVFSRLPIRRTSVHCASQFDLNMLLHTFFFLMNGEATLLDFDGC